MGSAIHRTARVASLGLSLLACNGQNKPAQAPESAKDVLIATDPPTIPLTTKSNCTEPTLPSSPQRETGIDAFLANRGSEAEGILSEVLARDPRDRAAEAFRAASAVKVERERTRTAAGLSAVHHVALEALAFAQVTKRNVETAPGKIRLERQSETKNLITDFEDWETKNQLSPHSRQRLRGEPPASVPATLGHERLRSAFEHADHVAAIYQNSVVITAEGRRPLAFDTRALMNRTPTAGARPLDVVFAQLAGKTLLLALAYNGYAKESGGKNGYFAAFDAATGALAWASEPLVANVREAVVAGGSIITGYGFTAEPDFLFVLDLATGKTEQKVALKSAPEAIRARGDRVFVRSYDIDYVFQASTGVPPAPPAALDPSGETRAASSADVETRCWVRRATASILAKDVDGLHEAAERLKPLATDRVLDDLLRFEETKLATNGRLDLAAASLVVVPAPPWEAASPAPIVAKTPKSSPKLVKISARAASPVRNMHPAFDPGEAWFIPPVDKGKLPEGARGDIPTRFGEEDLSAIIPDQRPEQNGRQLLVYGGRFVVLVANDASPRIFDLEAFRHPPKANPQWKQFAVENVTYAQERDGVLYVCNGGGSYAKEVFGKKGFLSAIDATSGKLLWRSAPLTCNATFGMTKDHIVSGYGFTAEPDFVFVVRQSDGGIVQKVPVDSGPETIKIAGNRVHVETYGHVADFDLR